MSKSQTPRARAAGGASGDGSAGQWRPLPCVHETLCTELPEVPSRALQGQWAARPPMKTLCPRLLSDSAPHGWVSPGSGQLFALSVFFAVGFSLSMYVTRERIICSFIHSVNKYECLLCARHCAQCWGYCIEKIAGAGAPGRGVECRSGGYKVVGANGSSVGETAWRHEL